MAEKVEDCKIGLTSSKQTFFSSIFTLKLPYLFTLPGYHDPPFDLKSSSFEFNNSTWRFHIYSVAYFDKSRKRISISIFRLKSEIPREKLFCKFTLQGENDDEYHCEMTTCLFAKEDSDEEKESDDEEKSDEEVEYNEKYFIGSLQSNFYDRHETLTLTIHLFKFESIEVNADQVLSLKNLPDMMVEKIPGWQNCKFYSTSRKNSSHIYTLQLPNFFTLPECDKTSFELNSPSFNFANGTWSFRFYSMKETEDGNKRFAVFLVRLNYEIPVQNIFYKITLFGDDDRQCKTDMDVCYFKKYYKKNFMWFFDYHRPSYDRRDNLTLIIHLFSYESTESDANHIPSIMDRENLLSQDFKNLFLSGKNSDLTLKVGHKDFRVHQHILMARSQVFEATLSHDMQEKNGGVVVVPDCDPQAMEELLFYVYSGKVRTLNQDNALGLYYAADKYCMTLLKEECAKFIKESLSSSIVADVIQLALNQSDTDLLECATKYFVNHTNDILPTVGWMSLMKSNPIAANELFMKASKKWFCAES